MTTTLFALCATDGTDALFDALDQVSDEGVPDSEWEWLRWQDHNGREFVVVRGSMSARGAFAQCDTVKRVRLSVADRFARDGRADWIEPASAQEGRDILDEWMASPGMPPLSTEVITAAKPKPEPGVAAPLIVRGRERLAAIATPISSTPRREPGNEQQRSRIEPRGDGGGSRGYGQHGGRTAQPRGNNQGKNSVAEAFGLALGGKRGEDGQAYSLYRLNDPDAESDG